MLMFYVKSIPEIKFGVLSYFTSINFQSYGISINREEQKIELAFHLLNVFWVITWNIKEAPPNNMNGTAIRRFFCISQRWDFLKSLPNKKRPTKHKRRRGRGIPFSADVTRTMGSIVLSLHGQWLPLILIEHRVWLSTETAQVQA